MLKYCSLIVIFHSALFISLYGQSNSNFRDERELYAHTKQVNQFFRRFNNEESVQGTRYYKKDSLYRDIRTRNKYLNMLFDNENYLMSKDLKNSFISFINNKNAPVYLDFHGGKWFAQANAVFKWHGKEERLVIFLQLQQEKLGSKWIISKINFPHFDKIFEKDSTGKKYFLHPLSHELDFMNLHKAIENNNENIEDYTGNEFKPDHLTLFLNEVKNGTMEFVTITKVKFHFFQVPDWYFELSQFNRPGNNAGWLISSLTKVTDQEKESLAKFIYNKNE
jgi:hypothetical protein